MSKKEEYESKTTAYILPILEEYGFSLYDVLYVKEAGEYFLRVYIDKDGGITIEDCVTVSRRMNEILDREDYIADTYTFEVSSPGVERNLRKDEHFASAIGEAVYIKTFRPVDGRREMTGTLLSYDGQTVTLRTEDEDKIIPRADIAKIHTAFIE